MSEFVVDNTELVGGKLKKANGFLEPNFGVGTNPSLKLVRRGEYFARFVSVI